MDHYPHIVTICQDTHSKLWHWSQRWPGVTTVSRTAFNTATEAAQAARNIAQALGMPVDIDPKLLSN